MGSQPVIAVIVNAGEAGVRDRTLARAIIAAERVTYDAYTGTAQFTASDVHSIVRSFGRLTPSSGWHCEGATFPATPQSYKIGYF